MKKLIVATRGSRLALAQTHIVCRLLEEAEIGGEAMIALLGQDHPGGFIPPAGKWGAQAVQVSELDQLPVFLHQGGLLRHFPEFLRRKFRDIELVAEGAEHGGDAAGAQGLHAAELLIWHPGDMGSHAGHRVDNARPVLDRHPFHGIGIV